MSRKNGKGAGRYTAYDPQGNAHVKTFSSNASTASDTSDATTTRANTLAHDKPTLKFAKVPAAKRQVVPPEDNGGRNVRYDSESDDDDDDDFFTF